MINSTIKRHQTLQLFSKDHIAVFNFCWRLRTGLFHSVAPERLIAYSNWFYEYKILLHIKMEEEYLFPLLGMKNELVKKAVSQHKKLKRLFETKKDKIKSISLIEEELEKHLRFEEKILYNEIQNAISDKDILHLQTFFTKNQQPEKEWKDAFWEIQN